MERHVTTHTGMEVVVRPIVPADREALLDLFEQLGPESRYSRFMFLAQKLSDAEVSYFTEVDHHLHEGLWALGPGGKPLGTARYVRLDDRPGVAEIAVTIADGWHEHGIGTALLKVLAERASAEGIERFLAICLPGNAEMIDMARRLGGEASETRLNGSLVEIEAPLGDPPGSRLAG